MPELAATVAPAELLDTAPPAVPETAVPVCDVCGGTRRETVAAGFDYELQTCANRWTFVECIACTHVWLDPRPSVEALDTIYPSSYYAYNYQELSAIARAGKARLDRAKLQKIIGVAGRTPESYLDVGCGDGRYLEVLATRGVPRDRLYGLELDDGVVEQLKERGFQVHCERVETCDRFPPGSIDLITMFHVIEHVASPRDVVERLAGWLSPGGVLALETPNLDSLDARSFRRGLWGGYHIPRHWHLFRPATMTRLVESVGLEVEDIRYETGHAFWMYSLHHKLRYGKRPHPRLARFFDPFSSLLPLVAFTAFDKVRALLGAKTSAMLIIARRNPDGDR